MEGVRNMQIIKGGVTAAKGFQAVGIYAGIKKKKKDLALVFSEKPAHYAGTFTTNVVKAAPVLWNQERLASKRPIHAIVINSGNANACTGKLGSSNNERMAQKTGYCLGVDPEEVLVASTGVIGVPLPIEIIEDGIETISKEVKKVADGGGSAAEAIMTTDTFTKEAAAAIEIDGKTVCIGGMAKGSGMIHPNMATMLSFVTTDANISQAILQELLSECIQDSYNMISVDGDTSTNDMVMMLSNGAAENAEIVKGTKEYEIFKEAFYYVHTILAQMIVRDGEGAGKFIEVSVEGAITKEDAKKMGKSVLSSNLVKTAFFGEDANWGRILCAMGYSGASFDPSKISMEFSSEGGSIQLIHEGTPLLFDEELAFNILKEKDIYVTIHVNQGEACAKAWGCDLSYEYVRINGEYRT